MQEELHQFERIKVWYLVPRPEGRTIIGTRWVFRNKLDENGVISRNKSRLVVQGYNQEKELTMMRLLHLLPELKLLES